MIVSTCQVLEADLNSKPYHAQNINTPHGFFTRNGGVSKNEFSSLNLAYGSGDKRVIIEQNRSIITRYFHQPLAQLCTLKQIHSPQCVYVDTPLTYDTRPQADAMVTSKPDIILGILTADCAPVLFYDAHAKIIGAAHAGWKGAASGILKSTINMMIECGAKTHHIHAAIGPCIGKDSYEVDQHFYTQLKHKEGASNCFSPSLSRPTTHHQFDLKRYVQQRLTICDIENITVSPYDTYVKDTLFFSYRRTTHEHKTQFGRQISAIMLS